MVDLSRLRLAIRLADTLVDLESAGEEDVHFWVTVDRGVSSGDWSSERNHGDLVAS